MWKRDLAKTITRRARYWRNALLLFALPLAPGSIFLATGPASATQTQTIPSQVTTAQVQPVARSTVVSPEHACNGDICAGFVRLPPASVVPFAASCCNGRACIYLTGSGFDLPFPLFLETSNGNSGDVRRRTSGRRAQTQPNITMMTLSRSMNVHPVAAIGVPTIRAGLLRRKATPD